MDRDHSQLGGIIVRKERHLLRPFEVRSSEIQVVINIFFLEKLVDAHASSVSAWRRPCGCPIGRIKRFARPSLRLSRTGS